MNATDASAVLLAREIESQAANAGPIADLSRADEEARRAVGEHASFEDWLSHRAQWIIARAVSSKAVGAPSPHAGGWTWIAAAGVLVAFAIGVASDAIGPAHRINILAPPLLALLAWNLAVYAVLALRRLPGWRSPARDGPLRRTLGALLERGHRLATAAPLPEGAELRARHARAWAGSSRDLWAARVAATVHAAAAMLVMGALCSLYLRGLALEYRAGWESTFLDAASVHALLTAVLGPAAQLALDRVNKLDGLRAEGQRHFESLAVDLHAQPRAGRNGGRAADVDRYLLTRRAGGSREVDPAVLRARFRGAASRLPVDGKIVVEEAEHATVRRAGDADCRSRQHAVEPHRAAFLLAALAAREQRDCRQTCDPERAGGAKRPSRSLVYEAL